MTCTDMRVLPIRVIRCREVRILRGPGAKTWWEGALIHSENQTGAHRQGSADRSQVIRCPTRIDRRHGGDCRSDKFRDQEHR